MRLEDKESAKLKWEKDKYADFNNSDYKKVCLSDCTETCIRNDEAVCKENRGLVVVTPIQSTNIYGCKTCEQIDSLCEEYYLTSNLNTEERNNKLIERICSYEINAYKLLLLKESFGITNPETCDDISNYLYSSEYTREELEELLKFDVNINDVRIDVSRWCSSCGARKPDILP